MRSHYSVRAYLLVLIVSALLPPLIFGGFLVLRAAGHEQDLMEAAVRYRTRVAAATIENELYAQRGRLFLLAGGISLQTSDLDAFHARARDIFEGLTVTLSNPAGQAILNTDIPFGLTPPDNPDPAIVRMVAETRRPRIGNLLQDPASGRPIITINVPVTRDSQLAYVLSLDIAPVLPRILADLDLPGGWVAAVFDRQGVMIARTRDPDRYVGQKARPEFIERIQARDDGWFEGVSREGDPLFVAFVHTRQGGWTVDVGIPRDILLAPVHRTIRGLVLLGIATLALAISLAALVGRRIAAPITRLVPMTEAVGREEPVIHHESRLLEANLVSRALAASSERLRQDAREREAATEALRRGGEAYRALAEDLTRVDAERRALLARAAAAHEDERKRIARDLHDSLGQYLAALHLGINKLGPSSGTLLGRPEDLESMRRLIDELGLAVHRMAWELRPVALEGIGLGEAVSHYLEEWAELVDIQVDIEINLGGHVLPPIVETTLFRVLQEAATNVLRHADARRVGIILEVKDDDVRLIVEDDGRGFPVDDGGTPPRLARQFGLAGMRERLALVQGELEVESVPGRGVTLFIRIPLGRAQPGWFLMDPGPPDQRGGAA